MKIQNRIIAAVFVVGIAVGAYFATQGPAMISSSVAQDEPLVSPTEARERDFYSPNSETLEPDEMRVIACGTGMPMTRMAQAAACFLVELGNGDKFIFDIGSGSAERLSALQIPYDFLDKVFIGHLHGDHFGDLGALFVGGALLGRHVPLQIWGPAGDPRHRDDGTVDRSDRTPAAAPWHGQGETPAVGDEWREEGAADRQKNQNRNKGILRHA